MNFDAFVDDIKKNSWNVHGVEVYEEGILTHSYGDTKDNIYSIYSATKTILSVAVGIAVDEGKFDIGRSVLDYLPEKNTERISEEQRNTFNRITIQRLLTMSVGDFPFRAEGESYIDFALNTEISKPEERVFHYSNIPAYLVGVALSEALGSDLGSLIEKSIFDPLGIDRFEYDRCPEGYFYGASGVKLTVNELSRIGLLLYNKGVFDGERILSDRYVEEATSVRQMNREGGYGYFIWKYLDGFSINGRNGQKCYVLPDRKIIVSFLSQLEEDSYPLRCSMEKNILYKQGERINEKSEDHSH